MLLPFSLNERFQKNFIEHLSFLEKYIIGKNIDTNITDLYGTDFHKNKLKPHRDMFLDIPSSV